MSNWTIAEVQDPSSTVQSRASAALGENDLYGPDWYYTTEDPADHPQIEIDWLSGWTNMRGYHSHAPVANWTERTLQNNDPIRWCTRSRPIRMCIEVRLDELAP